MHIYYRISDAGYNKEKPPYINNENCLRNFVKQFNKHIEQMVVIADNTSQATDAMILNYVPPTNLMKVSVGHGAGTFNIALDMALKLADAESVYFVENDYLHTSDAPAVLEEGLQFGFSFITLYDHPDKYLDPSEGGNPFCEGKSEVTRVYRTQSSHWKLTNSTKKGDPAKDDIMTTANIACNNAKRNMAAACDGNSEADAAYKFDEKGTPAAK